MKDIDNEVPACLREQFPLEAWAYNQSEISFPWTRFENIYVKKGRTVKALHLEHLLYLLWTGSLSCPDKSPERPRWASCSFGNNQDKTEASAEKSRLLVFDVDQGQCLESIKKVLDDFSYALHTTHSHTEATPSFRVILQADEPCKLTKGEYKGIAKLLGLKIDPNACNLSHVYLFPPCNAHYEAHRGDLIPVSRILSKPTESYRLRRYKASRSKCDSSSSDDFILWIIRNHLPNRFEGEGQTKWIPLFKCIAENYGQSEAISWAEGSWKSEKERSQDIKALSRSKTGKRIGKGSIVFYAYPCEESRKSAYKAFRSQ